MTVLNGLRNTTPEKRTWILESLPFHLAQSESWLKLKTLLDDMGYVATKIVEVGVNSLLQDYNLLLSREEVGSTTKQLSNLLRQKSHQLTRCRNIADVYNTLYHPLTQLQLDYLFRASLQEIHSPLLLPKNASNELNNAPHIIQKFEGVFPPDRPSGKGLPSVCEVSAKTNRVVVSSSRGIVRVYDTDSTEEILTIFSDNWDGAIEWAWPNCSIDPYGKVIAFISGQTPNRNYRVDIWKIDDKRRCFVYEAPHKERIDSCKVSYSGKYVVVAGTTSIRILECETGSELKGFHSTEPNIGSGVTQLFDFSGIQGNLNYAVAPHRDEIIVINEDQKSITVWDIEDNELVINLAHHKTIITHITYDSTGKWILSTSMDGRLIIWNTVTKHIDKIVESVNSLIYCKISPNNKFVLLVTNDGYDPIILEDKHIWTKVKNVKHVKNRIWLIDLERDAFTEMNPDYSLIAIGNRYTFCASSCRNDSIEVYENKSGCKLVNLPPTVKEAYNSVQTLPDSDKVVASKNGILEIWEYNPSLLLSEPVTEEQTTSVLGFITYNGRLGLRVSSTDKSSIPSHWAEVSLFIDHNSFEEYKILGGTIQGTNFVCSKNKDLFLFNITTGERFVIPEYQGSPSTWSYRRNEPVAVSHDLRFVAYYSIETQTPILFSVNNKRTYNLPEPKYMSKGYYVLFSFSPSGEKLADISGNSLRIWNTASRDLIQMIDLGESVIGKVHSFRSATFHPSENILITTAYTGLGTQKLGYEDKISKAWDINSGQLLYTLKNDTLFLFKIAWF